jgi:transcriptional regulator with XRE-family HTH domain
MTDTPAGARRRVRFAVRHAREERGLTQGQVADEMDWSLSKVMRIESGEVNISTGDLKMLLPFLGISDPADVERLLADAKTARKQRWTVDAKYREHLSPTMIELMQLETEATAIRYFHPVLVPGLLQTPAYASAIFKSGSWDDVVDEASAAVRADVRRQRRDRIFSLNSPPDYLVLLDESVLHRVVGGPKVMYEQLQSLLQAQQRQNVWIRIVPFASGTSVAVLGPFMILELDEEPALYREEPFRDEIVRKRGTVTEHRDIFERLWSSACGDEESAKMIEERASTLALG